MDTPDDRFHEQIREALRHADVLSIFFVRIGQSLIVDAREDESHGPAVLLDEIVASPRDRLESMRSLRPGMPLPDHMTLAPWTAAVGDFASSGLLGVLLDRCQTIGGSALNQEALRSYRVLQAIERRLMLDLVRGVGMKTIWSRERSR